MNSSDDIPIHERIGAKERCFLTVIIIVGVFMAILDTTIVEVIVPRIMAPLSTDIYGAQWVITAYMISAATALLIVESVARTFGLKKIFITGLVFFTCASFMCGHSNSLAELVSFRTVQGTGEAFLVATAETMLFTIYAPDKRGLAMGIYALAVSFAPALGPTLGGYITDHFSWRYVFFINVPIGILNFVAALAFIPEILKKAKKFRFNMASFFFVSAATIALLTLLSKGQEKGWFQSMYIIKLTMVSVACYLIYAICEILSKRPLIDFSIFKIGEFHTAIGIYFFILGLSMYQVFYLLPLYYENLRFLGTFQTGLHLMPMALAVAFFSIISGALSDKIGPEKVLIGTVIVYLWAVYFVLPGLSYYTPRWKTIVMTIPYGIGIGMFFAPVTTLALEKLGEKTNLGVSLMHYTRFVGGSFGTALATNSLQGGISFHYDEIAALQSRNPFWVKSFVSKWQHGISHFYPAEIAIKKAQALLGYAIHIQSMSHSFQDTFRESTVYAVLGCLFLAFFFYEKLKKPITQRPSVL